MALEYQELFCDRRCRSTSSINGVKILTVDDTYSADIKKALDQYYLERLLEEGCCTVCSAKTTKFCSNCGTAYCSVQCQNSDWSTHQTSCETILSPAPSVSSKSFLGTFNSSKEAENNCNSPGKHLKDRSEKSKNNVRNNYLNRGNKKNERNVNGEDGSLISKRGGNQVESDVGERNKTKVYRGQKGASIEYVNHEKTRSWVDDGEKSKDLSGSERSFDHKASTSFAGRGELHDPKGFDAVTRYQTGQTLKVKCSSWDSDRICWVMDLQNLGRLETLRKSLEDTCPNIGYVTAVAIAKSGKVYASSYQNEWRRVRVVSTEPKLLLRCIDTGCTFVPQYPKLKKLPPDLVSMEGMAFPVEFQSPVADKPDEVTIEIVRVKPDGTYEVKIREEIAISSREETAMKKFDTKLMVDKEGGKRRRRCVVDDLQVGYSGVFMLMQIQGTHMYGCLILESVEDADHCYKKITSLYCMEGDRIEAEPGDLVMVANGDNVGQRGIVKSKSPDHRYEVRLIDYGCTVWTAKVYKLPESAADLMELGCKVTLKSVRNGISSHNFEINTSYLFDVSGKVSDGKWSCVLTSDEHSDGVAADVIVEKAFESASEGDKYIPFESGSRVVISAINDDNAVYVRRVDGKWEESLKKLDAYINMQSAPSDGSFAKGLQKGDLVLSKFREDGLWYRAKVLALKGDLIVVLFVDFGNIQKSKGEEVKPLPGRVQREPFFARKVRLIGNRESFTRRGKEYLAMLVTEMRELIMTYDGDISEGVVLTEGDCFEINQMVYDALPKSLPNSPVKSLDPFTEKFLVPQCFPEGLIESFIVLHVNKEEFMQSGTFWAADPLNDNMKYVVEELGVEISNYCNSCTDPYTPRPGELCLALFEDDWYRGFALRQEGDLVEVFFVDFGNTSLLDPKSIRKMDPKFFHAPPPAIKCVLDGFDKFREDQRETAYEFLQGEVNNMNSVTIEKVDQRLCYAKFPELSKLIR